MLTCYFGERRSVFLVRYLIEIWDTASTITDARNDLNQIFRSHFWEKVGAQIYVPLIARHVSWNREKCYLTSHLKTWGKIPTLLGPSLGTLCTCIFNFPKQVFFSVEIHPLCNAFLPGELVQAINSHRQLSSSRDFTLRFLGIHNTALCKGICKLYNYTKVCHAFFSVWSVTRWVNQS